MLFDLFLTGVFLGSVVALWYFISLKIPELVAVSDAVIVERLHEDSARVRIFLLHFKTFYREGRHRAWLWKLCEKICYRAHIFLLRADNGIVDILQKIRAAGLPSDRSGDARQTGETVQSGNDDAQTSMQESSRENEYWAALRLRDKAESVRATSPISHVRAPRSKTARVQEVRRRKKEKMPE